MLTCQATSTLAEVVALMATHQGHAVFVVDPDTRPLCTITVTDVLRACVDNATAAGHAPPVSRAVADAGLLVESATRLESVTSGECEHAASVTTSMQSAPPQ